MSEGGRPRAIINWEEVDNYLAAGCSGREIASYLGIIPNTLYQRCLQDKGMVFSEYLDQKKAKGELSIRVQQYLKALGITNVGDNTLLIWLGKQRLGQSENKEKDESPKQEDLDLKSKFYELSYRLQQTQKELDDLKSKANPELQRSDASI